MKFKKNKKVAMIISFMTFIVFMLLVFSFLPVGNFWQVLIVLFIGIPLGHTIAKEITLIDINKTIFK